MRKVSFCFILVCFVLFCLFISSVFLGFITTQQTDITRPRRRVKKVMEEEENKTARTVDFNHAKITKGNSVHPFPSPLLFVDFPL